MTEFKQNINWDDVPVGLKVLNIKSNETSSLSKYMNEYVREYTDDWRNENLKLIFDEKQWFHIPSSTTTIHHFENVIKTTFDIELRIIDILTQAVYYKNINDNISLKGIPLIVDYAIIGLKNNTILTIT